MTAPSAPTAPRVLFLSAQSGLAEDRGWVFDLRERYDLVHWHGPLDGLSETCARRMTVALRKVGKPLVLTLSGEERDWLSGPLEVLVGYADAVIVADEGVAEAVRRRWERDAVVIEGLESDDRACAEVYGSVVTSLH